MDDDSRNLDPIELLVLAVLRDADGPLSGEQVWEQVKELAILVLAGDVEGAA